MGDLIRDGIEALQQIRRDVNSARVSLRRGDAAATNNVPARISIARQGAGNFDVNYVSRENDYVISAEDYIIAGSVVEPQDGDVIIDSSSGTALEYTLRPSGGVKSFEKSDNYGLAWRIHTKR